MPDNRRKKVAIVGSGCAGIAALWALNRTHHDVYLYEAADRLGGHTNTVDWQCGKYTAKVDTGFIVLNTATYPNFTNFLRKIGVPTEPTDTTFSVSRDRGAFEWAGTSLNTVFCQRRNLLSPRMWRMLFDIVRFNQFALDLLAEEEAGFPAAAANEPIGQYLDREGYSDAFRDDYLIPMTVAVWSTGPNARALAFPAATLVRFLWNHRLLSTVAPRSSGGLLPRSEWRTLAAGARSYVDVVMRGFPSNHLFLNTPVRAVTNDADGRVRLHLDGGRTDVYDHVVLATHGDEAYALVRGAATAKEAAILSQFHTSTNEAVLHGDTAPLLLPARRALWSSWNYLSRTGGKLTVRDQVSRTDDTQTPHDQVSLTYNMNHLQHIPRTVFGDVLVTLNPLVPPDPATVQGRFRYALPLYTAAAVRAQRQLPRIQNTRSISYAGAWTRHGSHEDGITSGLAVAVRHLGARLPFDLVDAKTMTTRSLGAPSLSVGDWLLRVVLWLVQVFVVETVEWLFGVRRGRGWGQAVVVGRKSETGPVPVSGPRATVGSKTGADGRRVSWAKEAVNNGMAPSKRIKSKAV